MFVVILARVVLAGAAGAVTFFTIRSQPDWSRGSTVSLNRLQRKVEGCVTSIAAPAAEAISDLENFNSSAMASVMAGFSVVHGADEYGVIQSVVSNVSQNLTSASWALTWKSAIKREMPTIESFCIKRTSISYASTLTTTQTATQNPSRLVDCSLAGSASDGGEYYESKFKNQYITLVAPRVMYCSSQYSPDDIDAWAFVGVGIRNAWNEDAISSGVMLTSVTGQSAVAPGETSISPSLFACAVLSGDAAVLDQCKGKSQIPQGDILKVLSMDVSNSAGVIEIVDPTNSFFDAYGSCGPFDGSQAETLPIALSDSSRQSDLFACDLSISQSNDCNEDVRIAFQVLKRMVGV